METEYVITNPKFETDLTQFKNRINELMLITDPSIFEVLAKHFLQRKSRSAEKR